MIKVKIGQGSDISILSLMYSRNQLPRGKSGEILYDYDEKNEIDNIYFKNHEYFQQLLNSMNSLQNNLLDSNASAEYSSLINKLSSYSIIDNDIDYGYLDKYSPVEKDFELREIDLNIIKNIDTGKDAFYKDMKRLYKGYDVTYWGSSNFVVIKFDYDGEKALEFDLKPIMDLLTAHNLTLEKFNLYRDPRRGLDTVRIGFLI